MTAAHCFSSTRTVGLVVYLGKQTLVGSNPYEVSRGVSKIIRHPKYNSFTNDNDITLLRLNSAVTFTDYIRPVCLAGQESHFPAGTSCWITGWGNIASGVLPSPGVLQEAEVPVVDRIQCDSMLGPGLVTENMICAGFIEGGTDTCQTLVGSNPYEVSRGVSKIIRHPKYNSFTNDNDITLLRLNSAVTFTDYIRPVCLAGQESHFPAGTSCWITGWGNIASGVLPSPGVLQEAEVPVVDRIQCDSMLGPGLVTENMICAGFIEGGTDTCQCVSMAEHRLRRGRGRVEPAGNA
ncbi:hypothetical protein PDJAM_G00102670 [Pangasius djambal]|uniref:Uncharacterized protein n=1 Tax=Pangasius djambal TaxID=1691987 RepID=A0ACC5Y0J6_9TELE|nr:hypothetical protein [Pangasius djambal]